MKRIISGKMFSLIIFTLMLVSADDPAAAGEFAPPDESMPDYGFDLGSLVTVMIALAFIIGLILLTVRLLAKNKAVFASRSIRNLGGVIVGQNKSVQLLQIGNAVYIIGVGEDVTLLEKIERQEDIDLLLQTLHKPAGVPGKGVWNYVRRWRKTREGDALPMEEADNFPPSFHEVFHGKMKRIEQRRKRLKDMLEQDGSLDGERYEKR